MSGLFTKIFALISLGCSIASFPANDKSCAIRLSDEAMVRLYEGHYRELVFVAFGRTRDEHVANDIAQEAFLRLLKERKRTPAMENPRSWLITTTVNLSENWKQSAYRRRVETQNYPAVDEYVKPNTPDEEIIDEETARALAETVNEIMKTLPEKEQEALRMMYWQGFKSGKIRETLGIGDGATKSRLNRGRRRVEAAVEAVDRPEFRRFKKH